MCESRFRTRHCGESIGPPDFDDPWNAHTDDQLGLLNHLGVAKFFVIGFCIGNPLIWNLMQRTPGRIVASVHAQNKPSPLKNLSGNIDKTAWNYAPLLILLGTIVLFSLHSPKSHYLQ